MLRTRSRLRALGLAAGVTTVLALAPLSALPAFANVSPSNAGPTLTAPADDPTGSNPLTELQLLLQWDTVSGATHYQVQISPNGDWTNNTVTLPNSGETVATSYAPPTSLPHASYFWHVRGMDSAGNHTAWSATHTFTRGWDVAPTVTTAPTGTTSNLSLAWNAMTGASGYEVRYSTDPSFPVDAAKTLICDVNHPAFTPYTATSTETAPGTCPAGLSFFKSGTAYYWLVQGLDYTDEPTVVASTAPAAPYGCPQVPECSAWTRGGPFTYTAITPGTLSAPGSPKVTGPGCASGCTDTPTLSWTADPNANGYLVLIALDPGYTNVQRSYDVFGTSLTPRESLLDNQAGASYYWAVASCNMSGGTPVCGRLVPGPNFSKHSLPVSLVAPADGVLTKDPQVTLSWTDFLASGGSPTQEAKDYDLQLSSDPSFDNVAVDVRVDQTQWTKSDSLLPDGTWYWRVAPIDNSDNLLTWSAARSFTLDTTAPVVSMASPNGVASTGPLAIRFSKTTNNAGSVHVAQVGGGLAAGSVVGTTNPLVYNFLPSRPLIPGASYLPVVNSTMTDAAGNVAVVGGSPTQVNGVVDDANHALVRSGGWVRYASSTALFKAFSIATATSTSHPWMQATLYGSHVYYYACRAPSWGKVAVQIDGVTKAIVSLYQSYTSCGRQLFASAALPRGNHTLRIVVVSGRGTVDAVRVA